MCELRLMAALTWGVIQAASLSWYVTILGDTNLISRLTGGRLQILGSVGRNNNNNNPELGNIC